MRELLFISDTPANKISYYFLLVFVVTLPFDMLYSELALAGLLVHTAIHLDRRGKLLPLRWPGWWIAGLFILSLLGMIYAPNIRDAWKECEKQLALLLFPLIACFSWLDWGAYRKRLLRAFSFTCLFTSLYLFGVVAHTLYRDGLPLSAFYAENFINHPFTHPIGLHATYFSMYMSISLVTFISEATSSNSGSAGITGTDKRHYGRGNPRASRGRKRGFSWGRAGYTGAAVVCLAAILQLASRAVCIADLIMLTFLLPWYLRLKRKDLRVFAIGLVAIGAIAVFVVMRQSSLHDRYVSQFRNDLQRTTGREGDPEPRMARWSCAWELIERSPLVGYGTGAEPDLLRQRYYAHSLMIAWLNHLNAHNQYLSFLIGTGIPGLAAYLILLGLGFREAWRRRDFLLATFLLLVCLVSFSENILDVNKGIFFFSFFLTLFLYRPKLN